MDGLDDEQVVNVLMSLQGDGERPDYENETIDFSQFEKFIHSDAANDPNYFSATLSHQDNATPEFVPENFDPSLSRTAQDSTVPPVLQQPFLNNAHASTAASSNAYSTVTIANNSAMDTAYPYAQSHLPDSPPDSGSEPPYSPQEGQIRSPLKKNVNGTNVSELVLQNGGTSDSNGMLGLQMQSVADNALLRHSVLLAPLLTGQHAQNLSQTSKQQALMMSPSPLLPASSDSAILFASNNSPVYKTTSLQGLKKRKLSTDSTVCVKQEPEVAITQTHTASGSITAVLKSAPCSTKNDADYKYQDNNGDSGGYSDSSCPSIRFQSFQQSSWHTLCDQNLKDLPAPVYNVSADKGFNFSNADEAFVCQKKNHFQVTCQARLEGEAQFVKTTSGIRKISSFNLHFYGVKVESPSQTIKVEQSQSDRSKKAFHPVLINLRTDQLTKVTVGRLHFSETTSNNMRKKGKPNPDQRYFHLVVGLHAHCDDYGSYPIVAQCSEKIIVRASNPGQFENDVELCWQRGNSPESIFHAGQVGINTEQPDEALVVHGNVKVTGHIMKPSDYRIKTNIKECDNREQLRNIQQLNVVRFMYSPEFSSHVGLLNKHDTGVIAQEVQKILPDAVTTAGSLVLPNGTKYENFLLVDKERIYMENVGAVKELCKVTDNLETRIDELERMNRKLVRLRRHDSTKSTSSYSTVLSGRSKSNSTVSGKPNVSSCTDMNFCSNYYIQAIIVVLVFVIAVCLASIATLYFLELRNPYSNNLSTMLNNEKLNRLRPQWSMEPLPSWNTSLNDLPEFDHSNATNLKEMLHTYHNLNKLRTKGRQSFNYPTAGGFSDHNTNNNNNNADSASTNSNQKITKHKLKPSISTNNLQRAINTEKTGNAYDSLPTHLTALGRPANCTSMLSTFNSVLHYWDASSPCQSFCCFPGVFHTSGDENDQMSQDMLKLKFNEQKDVSSDLAGQVTPAANTLEDTQIMSYTSKDTISELVQDQHFDKEESKIKSANSNKNSLDVLATHRNKRYSMETRDSYSANNQYPKGINYGITVSVRGSNFNQTLNSSYCNVESPNFAQCVHESAANISYIIPLSRYLSDTHLDLIFQFSKLSKYQKVVSCSSGLKHLNVECPAKNHEIYWMKSEESNRKIQNPQNKNFLPNGIYFNINISNSLVLIEKYRVLGDTSVTDLCQAPEDKLGSAYLEYNIYFLRNCAE